VEESTGAEMIVEIGHYALLLRLALAG